MELTTLLTGQKAMEKRETREKTTGLDGRCGATDTLGQLKECEYLLRKNEALFNLEDEEEMIDCRIYEREALLARYQYLLRRIRIERASGQAREVEPTGWKWKEIFKKLLPGHSCA